MQLKRPRLNLVALLSVSMLNLFNAGIAASAYNTPKNLEEGWDAKLQLGALATFGKTDTSSVSARTDLTFRGERIEHEFSAKLYRSASRVLVARRDVDGNEVSDSNGVTIQDLVKSATNDRRFLSAQPRWFFSSRFYLFALADLEVNKPADIKDSSRQIGGVGYKLWKNKHDVVSAAFGVGRKKLVQVSGDSEEGAIAYVGLRFKRRLRDDVSLRIDLDSDFGGDNRFSEADVSLGWKLSDTMSLKLRYEARFNSKIINPLDTFDEDVEAAFSINLEVDVF